MAQTARNRKPPSANGRSGVSNNGNHLLTQFERVYGQGKGDDALRKTINAFNKSGAGVITEKYKMGQYGYSVSLKVGDQVITEPSKIKDIILKHAPTSAYSRSQYPNSPQDARNNTRFFLHYSTAGGGEKALTNRFAAAYTQGDKSKANQVLASTVNKYMEENPGKIQIIGGNGQLGQPGAFIQVLMPDGKTWSNDTDIVEKRLRNTYRRMLNNSTPTNPTLPPPPTSVGTPAVAPPPTTDPGSGTPPPASDPPVDPTDPPVDPTSPEGTGDDGSDPVDPGDGTTTDEPPTDDDTGEDTTDTEDTGSDTTDTGDTGDGSGTEDSYDETGDPGDGANQGDAPGTESTDTTDTLDNSGATDKSTLDTKRKGATASKAYLRRQERIASGVNDVDLTKAAQKSQSLLAADRNNDQKVSKQEQKVFNPADSNNNGTVNTKELKKYIATVDLDKDNKVKPVEAKAFRTLDSNDDKNIGNKELKAFNTVAGEDGKISRKEAKDALKAQIDTKQDKREHDLAVEYLRRTNEQKGGSQAVGEQAAALAVSQPAKHDNKDHDGPGGKGKGKGKGKG